MKEIRHFLCVRKSVKTLQGEDMSVSYRQKKLLKNMWRIWKKSPGNWEPFTEEKGWNWIPVQLRMMEYVWNICRERHWKEDWTNFWRQERQKSLRSCFSAISKRSVVSMKERCSLKHRNSCRSLVMQKSVKAVVAAACPISILCQLIFCFRIPKCP